MCAGEINPGRRIDVPAWKETYVKHKLSTIGCFHQYKVSAATLHFGTFVSLGSELELACGGFGGFGFIRFSLSWILRSFHLGWRVANCNQISRHFYKCV